MKLFRRLLIALFPSELTSHAHHPVSMFLSLISPKQVFSLVYRKIIENYKLNLYDIAGDPFEVKIGLGDQPTLQVQDIDKYYAYDCVAQMNGRTFYSPGNIATAVSLVAARQWGSVREKYDWKYAYMCILSAYLLVFVFAARIRVFPAHLSKNEAHQRCLDLFFDFCMRIADQQKIDCDEAVIVALKKDLLHEMHMFFFLVHVYKEMNGLLIGNSLGEKEFYQRLFADEVRGNDEKKKIIETFLHNRTDIIYEPRFGGGDVVLASLILPTDVSIKYIFQEERGRGVGEYILSGLFDNEEMDVFMRGFLKDESGLHAFLQRVLDREKWHTHFFAGMKKMSKHLFRYTANFAEEQEIEEFISSLQAGKVDPNVPVPEAIKQESQVMERLMNFYTTFVGGLTTGRGDALGVRIFKKGLFHELIALLNDGSIKQDLLQRYGALLYTYSKNIFYYAYAYDHIRAGKEVFSLPYKSTYKEVYTHMYLLKLFDEHFIATLLQDYQTPGIIITVTQKALVDQFQKSFQERMQKCLMKGDEGCAQYLFGSLGELLGVKTELISLVITHTTHEEWVKIKERLYSADFHIWVHVIELLTSIPQLKTAYGKSGLVGIAAGLKETLFGFLLYCTFMQQKEHDSKKRISDVLIHTYLVDVLGFSLVRKDQCAEIIEYLLKEYEPLFSLRIKRDDTPDFMRICYENRSIWSVGKTKEQCIQDLTGDDVVRLRGLYKTITYYNKRIIQPVF